MTAPTIPTVEDLPLEQLHEWPRNPRRISKPRLEQLKRALVAEPEMLRARPLIALPDGTVVAGNQRLRAARELGWVSLPACVVDLEPDRAAEWALRDNQGYGEDDEALVGALLAELAAAGRDIDLTGYDSANWRHETLLYGWVNGAAHRWHGGRSQDTVWEIPRPKRSELHPTMKPVELVQRALVNHSTVDDLVLDPFGGAGSTMVAAEILRRRCAMLELDPGYCDVIRQRYADFTNQPHLAP